MDYVSEMATQSECFFENTERKTNRRIKMFEIREMIFWTELPNGLKVDIKTHIGKDVMNKLTAICKESKDFDLVTIGMLLERNQQLFEQRIQDCLREGNKNGTL